MAACLAVCVAQGLSAHLVLSSHCCLPCSLRSCMLLLPAGALPEGVLVFALAAHPHAAPDRGTVHRNMLLLCGSSSVAVRIAMSLPLPVTWGAVLCSTWWWPGQYTGYVPCRSRQILLFWQDTMGAVVVAYALPMGAAKLAAMLCTQSYEHTLFWLRGPLSQNGIVDSCAHKPQVRPNCGVYSS